MPYAADATLMLMLMLPPLRYIVTFRHAMLYADVARRCHAIAITPYAPPCRLLFC